MVKHYYVKAHLKMALGRLKEAINDLSNAIIVTKDLQSKLNDPD